MRGFKAGAGHSRSSFRPLQRQHLHLMAETEDRQDNLGPSLTLEGRVQIYTERPIPELDTPGATAYTARYRNDATQELVAYVCNRGLLPRIDMTNPVKMLNSPCAIRLREAGVVAWPLQNAHVYAFAFDRPLADRYWKTLNETHPQMSEDSINRHFVEPMIGILGDYQRMGVTHGAIRPTNIFWRDGSTTAPQLGEGVTVPCGVGQPALFEPIERAMCSPLGRGPGWHADDCYAFGVTLAFVVLGANPVAGMSDADIIHSKLEKGTFNTLVGKRRLAGSHIELLRGLLADDAHQRWTAEDMEQWIAGRRLTPKSSDAGRRASRHFDIGGKEYWQVRPLAQALFENVPEAVKVIENGGLEKWVTRSLGDEERAKTLAEAVEQLKESGASAHYQDQLVARACMAMDPAGPIRYRGIAVMPSGIATVLADAMISGNNLQVISEIIAAQFTTLWVNLQRDAKVDLVPMAQQLERMRGIIEKTTYGNGLERAAYELNPTLPCQSPMLRNECVLATKQVLPALERVAGFGNHPAEPMDRHLAAFLVVRDKRSESLFASMSPTERPLRRALAMLSLFSDMQYRFGPDVLTGLAGWILPLVEPCAKRFLSKPMQEKVRNQLREAAKHGSLATMLKRVDDPHRVTGDENDFWSARQMYQNVQKEIRTIESELASRETISRELGRPVAATFASMIALVLIALTFGRALLHAMLG